MVKIYFSIIVFLLIIFSCSKPKNTDINTSGSKKKKESLADSSSELSRYNLASENPDIISLPKELKEISGLTMTPDGRLFAHQDESSIIYQVDYKTGNIIKKFSLGSLPDKGDFEDIAYAGNKFYLLKSSGDIYEFPEGEDGGAVQYKIHKTELSNRNDVEGLCYDSETNSLLLVCKGASGTDDQSDKAVYSFSLDSFKLNLQPRFTIKVSDIKKTFNPSGIQKHPKTGTYFIIAASGNTIIELSKEGVILGKQELPASVHVQPEGIAFDKDNSLLISNEGKSGNGYIVVYPYKN